MDVGYWTTMRLYMIYLSIGMYVHYEIINSLYTYIHTMGKWWFWHFIYDPENNKFL